MSDKLFAPTTVGYTKAQIAAELFAIYENHDALVEVENESDMLRRLTDEMCQEYVNRYFLFEDDPSAEDVDLLIELLVRMGLIEDDE